MTRAPCLYESEVDIELLVLQYLGSLRDMTFVNNYIPVADSLLPEEELWGPEPYDINFAFPIHLDTLESERVKLVPFVPREHAQIYWDVVGPNPSIFRYYPVVLPTLAHFLNVVEIHFRRKSTFILFAIIDKTKPDPAHPALGGSLAGTIGLYDASPANLKTEIAYVVVFPAFQRTHVASNAVGLLATYCLQAPLESPPGLGMRRVQYSVHPRNEASKRLAKRAGLKEEGTLRYMWILPPALEADGWVGPERDPRRGRHTMMLAMCWDDWEGGEREKVRALIDRKA